MRLSGVSLLGLLVALAIVALLCLHLFAQSARGTPGVGSYQNAVRGAEQSVVQQDRAATQAQTTLP
jgi:hypothetical protein